MKTLTPAYGRDYLSDEEVIRDFHADKDFIINDINSRWDGLYVNRSQLIDAGDSKVNIRYNSLRRIIVVEFGDSHATP